MNNNELLSRRYSVDVGVVKIVKRSEGRQMKKQCGIDFIYKKYREKFVFVYIT